MAETLSWMDRSRESKARKKHAYARRKEKGRCVLLRSLAGFVMMGRGRGRIFGDRGEVAWLATLLVGGQWRVFRRSAVGGRRA